MVKPGSSNERIITDLDGDGFRFQKHTNTGQHPQSRGGEAASGEERRNECVRQNATEGRTYLEAAIREYKP